MDAWVGAIRCNVCMYELSLCSPLLDAMHTCDKCNALQAQVSVQATNVFLNWFKVRARQRVAETTVTTATITTHNHNKNLTIATTMVT